MLFKEIKKKTISQINKQIINAEEKKLKKKMKLYRNKSIENKLNKNYVKLSMYERGIKFEHHKKMKLAQLFEENNKRLNIVYSFQPDISYKNLFTKIFAGMGGIDSYSNAISDTYQDNFGEGIFTGKGIFDLKLYSKLLKKEIPENTVLSHDLLEGSYLRCRTCNRYYNYGWISE